MIRELITYANERIIVFLPGGGIHEGNAERVMKETKKQLNYTEQKIVGDLSP